MGDRPLEMKDLEEIRKQMQAHCEAGRFVEAEDLGLRALAQSTAEAATLAHWEIRGLLRRIYTRVDGFTGKFTPAVEEDHRLMSELRQRGKLTTVLQVMYDDLLQDRLRDLRQRGLSAEALNAVDEGVAVFGEIGDHAAETILRLCRLGVDLAQQTGDSIRAAALSRRGLDVFLKAFPITFGHYEAVLKDFAAPLCATLGLDPWALQTPTEEQFVKLAKGWSQLQGRALRYAPSMVTAHERTRQAARDLVEAALEDLAEHDAHASRYPLGQDELERLREALR